MKNLFLYCLSFILGSMLDSSFAKASKSLETVQEENVLPNKISNPKFQTVLNVANAFYDFCETDQILESLLKNGKSSAVINAHKNINQHNLEVAKFILGKVSCVAREELSCETLLYNLLQIRLNYLVNRFDNFVKTKECSGRTGVFPKEFYVTTNPNFFASLRAEDQLVAKNLINRYQFLNLIIYHLYKLCDPFDLHPKTKQLISCSRTLWPILRDETTDLSNPDFACCRDDCDSKESKFPKDYEYYRANYKGPAEQEITLMNWTRQKTTITRSHPYLRTDEPSEGLELPEPDWLYQNSDEKVFPEIQLPFLKNRVQKSRTPQKKSWKKSKKALVRPKKNRNTDSTIVSLDVVVEENQDDLEQRLNEPQKESIAQVTKEIVIQDHEKDLIAFAAKTDVFQKEKDQNKAVEKILLTDACNAIGETPLEIEDPIGIAEILLPRDKISLPPRGMRLFHGEKINKASEEQTELLKINSKSQKLIDIIFDPAKKGRCFNFGEFKSLWERLNGTGSVVHAGSGGSHVALLNRTKQTVGGTFAHNLGQEYNQKTVRYLRDALIQIGVNLQN